MEERERPLVVRGVAVGLRVLAHGRPPETNRLCCTSKKMKISKLVVLLSALSGDLIRVIHTPLNTHKQYGCKTRSTRGTAATLRPPRLVCCGRATRSRSRVRSSLSADSLCFRRPAVALELHHNEMRRVSFESSVCRRVFPTFRETKLPVDPAWFAEP